MADVTMRSIRKSYGDHEVVKGLDLAVTQGEVLALLGPSGCGKTTTLRMVAGLEVPSAGELLIGGEPMSGPGLFVPPERRRLGMVFQSYAVWPHKTVAENVAYPLVLQRVSAAERQQKVQVALAAVRLDGLAERYPNQLSGGQQQRVALARALVAEPRVLLLDEPLSNLDAHLREEMRDEIRALVKRRGVTVLFVTHDQEEALGLADRVAVMNGGVIEQVDEPEALYERPETAFVARFVGKQSLLPNKLVPSAIPRRRLRDASGEHFAFRPSRGRMRAGKQDGAVQGSVVGRVFLGTTFRYRVEVGSDEILVDEVARFEVGDPVSLVPEGGVVI